ncbi:MAG: TerB family tellurite resistance protein [Lentisphaeria bacterium]|nr:TerB family tellurite resistance protein [Lentisphaeria bacterium]
MGLAGGIIGGVIGGIIGGPWGIAVGAGLGAYLTGSNNKNPDESETLKMDGLKAFFLCLGKLAKTDGVVTQNEADFIKELLRTLELPAPARKQLIAAFNAGKTDPRTFPQCIRVLASYFPDRDDRVVLMQAFCTLAVADGSLDAGTEALLTEAEKPLDLYGYTESFIAENCRTYTADEPHPAQQTDDLVEAYRILEVTPDASDDEIKQARRKKLLEYHPDRIQGKGLPDSFIAFAAEQTRKINEAYDLISARRGMKNR